jgi:hypothetical protein
MGQRGLAAQPRRRDPRETADVPSELSERRSLDRRRLKHVVLTVGLRPSRRLQSFTCVHVPPLAGLSDVDLRVVSQKVNLMIRQDCDEDAQGRLRAIALHRRAVIAEGANPRLTPAERGAAVRALAGQSHAHPDGAQRRYGRSTIDRWIRDWRAGGLAALRPQPRSDTGLVRAPWGARTR